MKMHVIAKPKSAGSLYNNILCMCVGVSMRVSGKLH